VQAFEMVGSPCMILHVLMWGRGCKQDRESNGGRKTMDDDHPWV
jgi:hypothetical protein